MAALTSQMTLQPGHHAAAAEGVLWRALAHEQ
jgi:hypothetical protein